MRKQSILPSGIDLSAQLNPAQLEAVSATEGPMLVLAGAGSGKTRVVEYRVLNLIRSGVSPETILLMTFTRRAAREMVERASRHDPRCRRVRGGTFHAFANGVLRQFASALGLESSFTVFDQDDADVAVGQCAARLGLHECKKRFPTKETLQAVISKATNQRRSIEAVLKADYQFFAEFAPQIEEVRRRYDELKVRTGCLDYDDLLRYLLILLEQPEARDRLSQQYRYVMVDEYQDTNALQGDIAYLLAEAHRNIMVVGDDAQSIYRFRGAHRDNILKFPERFPGCRLVKLEQNYRSIQPILDVANAALKNMKSRYSKNLRSAYAEGEGERPQLMCFKGDEDEAGWIADDIKRGRDTGLALSQQAVLFRSGSNSIGLQVALRARNIPFQVFGGRKFNETSHVKDIVAHLRVLQNSKDELALNRILKLLPGIGDAGADRLAGTVAGGMMFGLPDGLLQCEVPAAAKDHVRKLSEAVRQALACGGVAEKLEILLTYYEPLLRMNHDDWPVRLDDLNSLRQIAGGYAMNLEQFLSDMAIEPPSKSERHGTASPDDEEPLTLSTIHSAKGLEWHTVYIMGVNEGMLPSSRSSQDAEDVEEEHRLFYVAVTRAKARLILTRAHRGNNGGIERLTRLSRFVEAPNVLSLLDRTSIVQDSLGQLSTANRDLRVPVLSKDELLQRLQKM